MANWQSAFQLSRFGRRSIHAPSLTDQRKSKLDRATQQRLRLELCEDRTLASGNPVLGPVVDMSRSLVASPVAELPTVSALSNDESQIGIVRHELVFIDPRVPEFASLIRDLERSHSVDVVVLDPSRDGITQVSEALSRYRDLDAVHFITHGNNRGVQLGGTWLDQQTVAGRTRDIANWGLALKSDADLLFYGCDLANGPEGRVLLDAVHALTGADVAASTDRTGAAALGGNWTFEFTEGLIQTPLVFSKSMQANYAGVLVAPVAVNDSYSVNEDSSLTVGPLATNLANYWAFNDGAGQTAVDSGAKANSGTLGNSAGVDAADPTWTAGYVGSNALSFNGTSDYVSTNSTVAKTSSSFTLTAWFKANTTTGQHHILWQGYSGGNGYGDPGFNNPNSAEMDLSVGTYDQDNVITFFMGYDVPANGADPIYIVSSKFTDTTQYHHVAVTVTDLGGGKFSASLYVDGVLEGTDTGVQNDRSQWGSLLIGKPGSNTRYFDGAIDEVRVYDTSLSGPQVLAIAQPGILTNDTDADGPPIHVNLVTVTGPSNGSLSLNQDGSFTYTPNPNFNGIDTFSYRANDGGTNSNVATVTVTVNSINDAPAGTNNTVTTPEDVAYIFAASDFGLTDPLDGTPNSLLAVKISSLPGAGSLTDNGVAVSKDQFISIADINAGLLRFTPASDANGASYASFTFQVQDNGGTALGGVDLDPSANTMKIDVSAVNDAPVNSVPGAQATADGTALIFSTGQGNRISISDVDAGGSKVQVTLNATNGTISLAGIAGLTFTTGDGTADATMTFSGTIAAINTALDGMSFLPTANVAGGGSVQIVTSDLGNAGLGGAKTDTDSVAVTVYGFVVSPASGLATTEGGGKDTFTVVMRTAPTANVKINVSVSNSAEGKVSGSLNFNGANWNTPQTVTVTGVDDSVIDGDQPYTIILAAATSTDGNYNGIDPSDVTATNLDDDFAGIIVSPTSGLVTTEAGGKATFTVVLASQPTANVTIPVSSSNAAEGTVSTGSLVFTPGNWNVAQTVTVTGVNDFVVDGNQSFTIVLGKAASSDVNYKNFDPADVSATNNDDDVAGITVSPISGLTTTESGGKANFTVVLTSQPTANVTIAVNSNNVSEGTVSTGSLVFTAANWNVAQTVTVTGVDEFIDDGDQAYTVVLGAAVSTDGKYSGMNPTDVSVTNTDDDTVGIVVSPTSGLVTTEAGGKASFTVVLTSQPTANVTIAVNSNNVSEGTVSTGSLVFTPGNWNVAQTVTVTGVDELVDDGDQAYTIVLGAAVSTDVKYSGIDPSDVSVNNNNDDTAGFTVSPASGLVTTEKGVTASFSVTLTSKPLANVTFNVTSSDTTEGTVSVSSLTFTPANWNIAQTVTITGLDDPDPDGNIGYTIILSPATSADGKYNGLNPTDVSVTNIDDYQVDVIVAPPSGLVTTEAGGTTTFTVVLTSNPVSNVTFNVSSSDPGEGTVSVSSLTFTSATWNIAQTVTITGVNDWIEDGDQAYTIIISPGVSASKYYNGFDPADPSVTNTDNDTAGVSVSPTSGLVTTEAGGKATFTVVLTSQPLANVSIPVSSSNPAEGSVSAASLVFTSANWNVPQTVTVTGVNEFVDDGDQAYSIVLGAAVSADGKYNGMNPADVSVTNADDDTVGIVVSPTSGLTTTEAGGKSSFTVVLTSQPTANVTIAVNSNNVAEGTVSTGSLIFTPGNWNVAQTVTVTGVDEFIDDGDQAYTIVLNAAVSADGKYSGMNPTDVSVTNTDDDTVGIVVSPTSGLATTEAGGKASFTVVLTSQPTANVTIAVSSSNVAEGTASTGSLIFTPGNWNVAQTVSVTGVDEFIDDGDQAYTVVLGAAVSTDGKYSGMNPTDVSVTNTDDDAVGIVVSPTLGLTTTEAGGKASFTVVLTSQPTANVTIAVSSSNVAEGTVSTGSLVFTPGNWNVAQTVSVTGVDEFIDDGDQAYTVVLGAAVSTDGKYSGINPTDVSVTNTDDDTVGIVVSPTSGLTTTEAGGKASFTVVLTSQPTANVTIAVSSSNATEGTVSTGSLIFTPGNWNVAQTVTVTGVDEFIDDGDQAYTIVLSAAVSADVKYSGIDPSDVACTNTDNDVAGVTVTPTSGLTTTESGGQATFTVVLTSQPTTNVTIPVSSSNLGEGTVSTGSVVFTPGNWNVAQTVTVTGVDEFIDDGDQAYTIVLSAAVSADGKYNGMNPADVSVTNADDDTVGIVVSPTSGLTTTEAGGKASFTVVLTSQPTANVTIAVNSGNVSEGTVSTGSLVFTPGNWNVAQTVTVTGVDEFVDDGDQAYSIVLGAAVSADGKYSGLNPADVSVTNVDDDTVGIVVTPTSGLVTTESGGTASFTVVLTSQPTSNVTIPINVSNAEGMASTGSLMFTPGNWNVAQTVTMTGLDDFVDDGNQGYTVILGVAVSVDGKYSGIDPSDVTCTNIDDDTAGIIVSPTSGLTTTEAGGTASFTVVLTSQPTANVTIAVSSSNVGEGTVSTGFLVFTAGNWNVAQTVTVTGVDEFVDDGDQSYTIVLGAAVSADGNYSVIDPSDVTCTNTDNDVTGVTVTPTSGLTTTESGGQATFTVVLTSQPTANVTVPVNSSNTAEGTVNTSLLVFTPGNWNVPQIITLTGVDDFIDDGDLGYSAILGAAISADGNYAGIDPTDVSGVNIDDDPAGIAVTPIGPITTTEAGGTANLSVRLTSQPFSDVSVSVNTSNVSEAIPSTNTLVFTPGNWNIPQIVIVLGVDDDFDDGDQSYMVDFGPGQSADPGYQGLAGPSVTAVNLDDDTAGIIVVAPPTLTLTEAGGTATFGVSLTSRPYSDVTINFTSTDTTEGATLTSSVVIAPADWNVPHQVTVVGVDDFVDDGTISFTIQFAPALSGDTGYDLQTLTPLAAETINDDVSGLKIVPGTSVTIDPINGTAWVQVSLTSEPIAPVTIQLTSGNPSAMEVLTPEILIGVGDWALPHAVLVHGLTYNTTSDLIVHSISGDANYLNRNGAVAVVALPQGGPTGDPLGTVHFPTNPLGDPTSGGTIDEPHRVNQSIYVGLPSGPLGTNRSGGSSTEAESDGASVYGVALPSRERMRADASVLPTPGRPLLVTPGTWSARGDQIADSLEKLGQDINHEKAARIGVARATLGTAVVVSAGYVLWSLRGAAWLASAVASSSPAWTVMDPMALLGGRRRRRDEDEDSDSLASLTELAHR